MEPHPQTSPIHKANKKETAVIICAGVFLTSVLLISLDTPFRPFSAFQLFFPDRHNGGINGDKCDYSYGNWVRDKKYSDRLYSEDCRFLDPGFQCRKNGRNDTGYLDWRWQPHGCNLPRFNASDLLERSRNGRIVFVGDSIGRNQWESFLCLLSRPIRNQSSMYEKNGKPITKHKGFLAIRFDEYNLTVEYYRAPYLTVTGRPPDNSPPEVKSSIRVDTMHWESKWYIGANVLIFNAGHWWTDDKTVNIGKYFQVGNNLNMTMNVKEAFERILETWKLWVLKNVELDKSYVFFRSYAPSHFSHGSWYDGGFCDLAREPEINKTALENPPWSNAVLSDMIREMNVTSRSNVEYLNITYLSEIRKDGHPSNHIEPGFPVDAPQDCSHWCLPGVPDTWNELLYAHLLSKGYDMRRRTHGVSDSQD